MLLTEQEAKGASIKPIPMNAQMVRAILDGRKTQTRRVVKPPKGYRCIKYLGEYPAEENGHDYHWFVATLSSEVGLRSQFYPGDVLWVREPGRVVGVNDFGEEGMDILIEYIADGKRLVEEVPYRLREDWGKRYKEQWPVPPWVSLRQGIPNGIFREVARLFIRVESVRVERLQDISREDVRSEGVVLPPSPRFTAGDVSEIHNEFRALWDSIAKPGAKWSDNPWVWVYQFERCDKPDGWKEIGR